MSSVVRRQMRHAPYAWLVLAVAVALIALTTRAVVLVLVLVAVTVERSAAVVSLAVAIADQHVSARAGLSPLAGHDDPRSAR